MPIHLYNLLLRSFFAIPTALGSTWLGLFFPLWAFVITQGIILLSDGWAKMKTHWGQNVVRGFAVAGVAWASLFVWCVVATTYGDHEKLAERVGTLRHTVDTDAQHEHNEVEGVRRNLGSQLSDLKQSCAELKGANGALTKQTMDQQGTINNCQTEALKLLAPESLKITPLLLEDIVVDSVEHKAKFLVITNKTITPVRMIVSCNRQVRGGFGSIVGSGVMTGGSSNQSPSVINVAIDSPAWTPISPLLVTLSYTSSTNVLCSFSER